MQQRLFYRILCSFLLLPIINFAQPPGYTAYSPEDKNTKFLSLFKCKNGYLLAGTTSGLFKFDGSAFHKIDIDRRGTADSITAIFEDNQNNLWIGCNSGCIATTQGGKLKYISPEEGTPAKKITSFTQDKKGNIWFGTAGEGLYRFYNKKMYLVNDDNGLSDLHIHALATTKNGDVLAATDQGINVCTSNGSKTSVQVIGPSGGLPDYIVTSIFPGRDDEFWIGMQDKGFCLYHHPSKKITLPAVVAGWNKGQVNNVFFFHDKVWIATQDSGLLCYAPLLQQYIPSNSYPSKTIGAIAADEQGNMWFAVNYKALGKTAGNTLQVYPIYNENIFKDLHALLVDKANNFWIGTSMAVIRYMQTDGSFASKKYPVPGLDTKTDITSLYQDKFNNIWIGTMGKGIYVMDITTGRTRQLKEASSNSSILSITGTNTTVCIAGLEGAMIFELMPENININHAYRFVYYNKIERIGSNYIYNVFKDSKGRIWFATDGKGLTMLYNGIYTHYNKGNGLQDEHIYAVTEDKKGRIWFSTSSAGIYLFDGKTFANYGVKDGLSTLQVSAVRADKEGNIVVVHKEGLDIINAATGTISYINAAQGIESINDDLGAVCTDEEGNVFVASKKGIIKHSTQPGLVHAPKTIIESVQLFLSEVDTATMHYFNYDENNFTFNFTGLYYTSPEKVFYEYKLEGLFNEWQFTTDNARTFPKLPAGKYVFKVRSSLNKNFKHASEAAFAFEIAKPFWRKAWFISSVALLIGGMLFFYIKRRERQLTHVQELKNEKIKFEFEVLRNQVNPHFLFNSFNTLVSTIEDNPKTAVEYVEHLSDFFRNIVNYRDKDIISLSEEMAMLQNYLYLQQKRYGNYLQLALNVDQSLWPHTFIPPLTLQLLVENAIKHNIVSKESALKVTISVSNDYIVVENNINKKITNEKGTGMGLQNIKSRYALLDARPVLISEDQRSFVVKLPVLKQYL